jgi:hypothetical protein
MKTKIMKIIILLSAFLFIGASTSLGHDWKGGRHKLHGNAYGYHKKHYNSYHYGHRPTRHYHKHYYHEEVHEDHHHYYNSYPPHSGFFFGMSFYDPNMVVIFGAGGY